MNNKQLIITRDGDYDYTYMPRPLTFTEVLQAALKVRVRKYMAETALQLRMASFDLTHGTNYRHIRNDLIRQKREAEFIKSIGLLKR